MNINELKNILDTIKYKKHQIIFFAGDKTKFIKLVEKLPGCEVVSVRNMLINACQEKNIQSLDQEMTSQLAKELVPKPQSQPVALVDNELLLKHKLFYTTMKDQDFQGKVYLAHIPDRYKYSIKNETLLQVG